MPWAAASCRGCNRRIASRRRKSRRRARTSRSRRARPLMTPPRSRTTAPPTNWGHRKDGSSTSGRHCRCSQTICALGRRHCSAAAPARPWQAEAACSSRWVSAHRRRRPPQASPSRAAPHGRSALASAQAAARRPPCACRTLVSGVGRPRSVDHRGGIQRAGSKRRQAEPDRGRKLPCCDPL